MAAFAAGAVAWQSAGCLAVAADDGANRVRAERAREVRKPAAGEVRRAAPEIRLPPSLRTELRRPRKPDTTSEYAAQPLPILGPLDARGTVTYFIDSGTDGSAYKPADRQLAEWALEAWARSSGGALRFEAAPETEALVRVHWVPAAAGQYGEMRPMLVNGRRGAAVYVRPDTSGLGPDIARMAQEDTLLRDTIVYLTCLHELGHALGLSHTAEYRDIMYFFGYGGDIPGFFTRYRNQLRTRADIVRVSGLSEADIRVLRMLYALQ